MRGTFGQRLARWREAAGLTQGELAGRVGVTPTYIGHLERADGPHGAGTTRRPVIEVVDAIAGALDVPLAEARCAAGYDPPEGSTGACEVLRNAFGESDFAVLHHMFEQLTPERRAIFRPILEMVGRELELILREQDGRGPEDQRPERRRAAEPLRRHPRHPVRPEASAGQPLSHRDRRRLME